MYCETFPLLPNRLAYPEHIDKNDHIQHFYKNNVQFVDILEKRIKNFKKHTQHSYASYVKKYDWQECVNKYDLILKKNM